MVETEREFVGGTHVSLTVSLSSRHWPKDVFDRFSASPPDDLSFSPTHVPIRLAGYGPDDLLSRSQARRVLAKFDGFEEVFLDFSDVEFIGQAFADEIFRVFRNAHPDTRLVAVNMSPAVRGMVNRASSPRMGGGAADK